MNRKIKSNELPVRLTPEGMRKEQAAKDKVILSWAAAAAPSRRRSPRSAPLP